MVPRILLRAKGICPRCDRVGVVGDLCGEKRCHHEGYHYIPVDDHQLAAGKSSSRDPNIGLLIEDYLVVAPIARGGFGKLYLSLQLPINMKAALKLLLSDVEMPISAQEMYQKFEGEALSLAQLNHPNIVRLLKYGRFEHNPYIVMEYVSNARTLKDEIYQRGRAGTVFQPSEIRHIIEQLLNAVESAHQIRIVHRDLKPENLMLQRVTGDDCFVRVLDFGLAKFLEHGSETLMMSGTPQYMAPEQITRKNIGPWTDLYALGVILYELITGRRPFAGSSTQEVVANKINPNYDPVQRLRDLALPQSVLLLLRTALALDINGRYQSAAEFRVALAPIFERLDFIGATPEESRDLVGLLDSSELVKLRTQPVPVNDTQNEGVGFTSPFAREQRDLNRSASQHWEERKTIASPGREASATPAPEQDRELAQRHEPSESETQMGSGRAPLLDPTISQSSPTIIGTDLLAAGENPGGMTLIEGQSTGGESGDPQWVKEAIARPATPVPRRERSGAPRTILAVLILLITALIVVGVWTDMGDMPHKKTNARRTPREEPRKTKPAKRLPHVLKVTKRKPATPLKKVREKWVEIIPVYYAKQRKQVIGDVTISVNGRMVGVSKAGIGVKCRFTSTTPRFVIKLSGQVIQTLKREVTFDTLPERQLEIKVKLDLGL